MSETPGALADLRREIDEIDQSLHDLLIRRAAVVQEVAAAKAAVNDAASANPGAPPQIIYPAREADVLRRLHARHSGRLPRPTLIQIWREIISASVYLQRPMRVGLLDPVSPGLAGVARDHFGTLISLQTFASAVALFEAIAGDADLVGLLPFPAPLAQENPWWLHLASGAKHAPRIVARLPFLQASGGDAALIGAFDPGESSDDISLFTIDRPSAGQELGRSVTKLAQTVLGNPPLARSVELIAIAERKVPAGAVVAEIMRALGDETATANYAGGYATQIAG